MENSRVNIPAQQIAQESIDILADLNPWWESGKLRKPAPPYRRRGVDALLNRMSRKSGLIEIIRGPRQVGKTTAIDQIIEYLLKSSIPPTDILFVRFDQEVLRASRGGLMPIIRWFLEAIRKRPFEKGGPAFVFLDEVHKLDRWDEDVKHLGDTFPLRLMLTGSSSVLVARGGRESLAGRVITTEMPTFQFREVVEAWFPIADCLPPARSFTQIFDEDPRAIFEPFHGLQSQQRHSLRRLLERYYNRGGYPRLYNKEVPDDLWADYLTQTIFERVLGVDVPDLFPVRNPKLLRWIYVEVARSTGQEIKQTRLADDANAAGFSTSQPHVGNYLHYLTDALLVREFRRYPIAKRSESRVPAKLTLTDLGARNAIFRGAPSLWESSPDHVGPLIETLAQSVIRGQNIQVHFFRDFERPGDRRTPMQEVDFVAENASGNVIPIEIKFRGRIDSDDFNGLKEFSRRYSPKHSILVTRDKYEWRGDLKTMCVPLMDFLLAF